MSDTAGAVIAAAFTIQLVIGMLLLVIRLLLVGLLFVWLKVIVGLLVLQLLIIEMLFVRPACSSCYLSGYPHHAAS